MLLASGLATVSCGVASAQVAELEEVMVTASRVNRAGFEAPTPTTVLNVDDLALQGAPSLTAGLNQLPAFFASATPATAGNSTALAGENFLNLRALGAPRTLVLVNGRRFVSSHGLASVAGSVDVNLIPQALIQRVEVVTGGASAAWGSDAVAGVVNYILDPEIEGFRGQAQVGVSSEGDNQEYLAALTYGAAVAGGRGHLTISGEISEGRGIPNQNDRDWGAQGWQVFVNPAFTPTNGQFVRLLRPNVNQSTRTEGGLILTPGPLQFIQFGPGGVPQPFARGDNFGPAFMVGGDGLNQGKYISLVTPHERRTLYGMASYDVTDKVKATAELSYGWSRSRNPVTSSFNFAPYVVTIDNPYIPASIRTTMQANNIPALLIGRINTDLGFITADIKNEVYRGVFALDGEFGETWKWQAYYTHGETHRDDVSRDNLVVARLAAAIDAVNGPSGPVCRALAANPGCVPLNLFGAGSPSAAAIDYVTEDQVGDSKLTQDAAAFNLSGEPFSTWAGPVSLAAGVEWRREAVRSTVDALSQSNAFLIGNPKNQRGDYNVKEAFAETVVPLAKDRSFAKSLEVNGAIRLTDYSTSGSVTTWKLGATWQINDSIRVRGTASRDIRAANLTELFQSSGLSFATIRDPRTGASVFVPSVSAGNPNLNPEKADTRTIGVVLEPSFVPGLRASVDYYDIEIEGAIGTLATQDLVNRCFGGTTALCSLIDLNPDSSIRQVNNVFINVSSLTTRGVDAEVLYTTDVADGQLTLRALATYVSDLITSDGVTSVDRAGQAQGTGLPHWRGAVNAIYRVGPLSVAATGRYVGGGVFDSTFGPLDLDDNDISSRFYVDLSAQYTVVDRGDGRTVEVYGLVNNLFNKDPPIVGSLFQAPFATNPALYDQVGTYFTLGVRLRY